MNLGPLHYHDTETTQSVSLGTVYRQDSSGRVWRYSENGAVQGDPGKLMVEAVTVGANHTNLSFQTAPAVGDQQILVTLGGTLVAVDDYRDGFAVIQDGAGEGILHQLSSHPAFDASATATFGIARGEQIQVLGVTGELNVDLAKSQYKDLVLASTDQNDVPVGVYNVTVAIDAFAMVQTWGPASVWQDEAVAIGDMVVTGTGTAGQVEADDASGEPLIGIQGPTTAVAEEYQMVYLKIER